jgi:(p)ppGpp synthase/HD superfamily hydrolase
MSLASLLSNGPAQPAVARGGLPDPVNRPLYSDRLLDALQVAARLHEAQARKGTTIPYLSHLLGTCSIAMEFGADEDQAIAALLHDAIEDVEPVEMARAEVGRFGAEVLRIVEACTDSDAHSKPPWHSLPQAVRVEPG